MHFVSPNFKTWPQAYIQPTTNYHFVTTIGRSELRWLPKQSLQLYLSRHDSGLEEIVEGRHIWPN